MPVGIPLTTAALLAAKAAGTSGVALGAGKTALAAGAGTGIGALPDIIPSRYERDQKKRLREMQRKQEMGALGLTERERAAIESQMRGTRQQAQSYADAERGRLTQPSAQPQMALLGQQMADESRQRLEADLASQVLGMDLSRQAEQEQEIKDLEAAQAEYRRRRFEGAVSPFQSASEAYVGQLGLEQLLGAMSPQQTEEQSPIQEAIAQKAMQQVDGLFPENYAGTNFAEDFGLDSDEQEMLGVSSPSPSQLSPDALFLLEALKQGELDVKKYLGGQ
jgi:hypothetical protein